MLRKLILGSSSFLLLGAAASAADLPAVGKAMPAAPHSWAGFYLGVHGGYGWGNNSYREYPVHTDPFPFFDGIKSQGTVVGAQAGYNWQSGRAVGGLEIDWSAADIKGRATPLAVDVPAFGFLTSDRAERVKYLGTVRGRLGWLAAENVLLYGTAGAAWERAEESRRQTLVGGINIDLVETTLLDRVGWVAGAGVEAMPFGPNWIARLEYLHYDFGAVRPYGSTTATVPGLSFTERGGRHSIDVLRAGLSYRLGVPTGASAAYARLQGPATTASWAGFYLGAHGGYGWGNSHYTTTVSANPPVDLTSPKLAGGVVGGHAGYNWQFDRAVAGFEFDLSATDIGGLAQVQYPVPGSIFNVGHREKVELLGSVRGRLGWLPWDSVLLYGTAGLGWERLANTEEFFSVAPAGTVNSSTYDATDRFGWVAGAGVETMLPGGNWIGRLEYLHYGFGTIAQSRVLTNAAGTFVASSRHQGVDVVRAGLSYKFGDPATLAPVRHAKAPVAAPVQHWAGFYLGAHAGYGWGDDDFTQRVDTDAMVGGIRSRGWIAGGHAGYNWQYGRLVTGLEADVSFAGLYGVSDPLTQVFGVLVQTDMRADRIKHLATGRGRLGWTPAGSVLLYATAGPAWERRERISTTTLQDPVNSRIEVFTDPANRFGGVIGAGVEWMPFGPNWIGRVEYMHYDFGKARNTTHQVATLPGIETYSERRGRESIDVLRAGISYKFQ